jgi:hypothetical protein
MIRCEAQFLIREVKRGMARPYCSDWSSIGKAGIKESSASLKAVSF